MSAAVANTVANYAAKRFLRDGMDKYKTKAPCGDNDPYFEYKKAPNGKRKKVKKQIPDFIPEHDAKILAAAKKSAYRLDMSLFDFMNIRFGVSSVIGLIPEIGDVIDLFFALRVYHKCTSVKAPLGMYIHLAMLLNIAFDFGIGLIPFLGDLVDAAFRCNTRNVALLEKALIKTYKPHGMSAEEAHKARLEEFDEVPPPPYAEDEGEHHGVTQPANAHTRTQRQRQGDVEMGNVSHSHGGGARG